MENGGTDKPTVVLIDFSALFRRAWHVATELSIAYESTVAGVTRAANMSPGSLVAVCCDGRGNWRKELSKEYKAQRESQPQQMYGEMDRTLDRLRRDGRLIWKFDGFEADDVIATAMQMAATRGHYVRIVSHDKDLLQLLGPWCEFVAIHKSPWETVGEQVVREKYGVEASQFADWLALVGDSSDNVKGCPGVGAKTATQLLQTFGTIDSLLSSAEQMDPRITPNVTKNLIAFKNQILTARMLVSLSREVPIKFDEIYEDRPIEAIDERDPMAEAEAEADKYFGPKHMAEDPPKKEPVAPETVSAGCSEEQAPRNNGLSEQSEKQPGPVAPADIQTKEIAVQSPPAEVVAVVEYTKQLEPRSMRDASIYADMMFHSRVYSRYPTKQAALAAIVRGRELGFGAGASLDMFHVADFRNNGDLRLIMHAHLIIDLVMKDPSLEYFYCVTEECNDTQAVYEAKVKRNPKPQRFKYTIEEAKKAGLVKPGSAWDKGPAGQLRKTCGVFFGRIVAPGAAIGLYCPEEFGVDNE